MLSMNYSEHKTEFARVVNSVYATFANALIIGATELLEGDGTLLRSSEAS